MSNYETMVSHFKTNKIDLKTENEDGDLNSATSVSSGIPALDVILAGGFFLGKVYELYGEESAGKTTLSYQTMAEFQKVGGVVLLLESESSFDTERARELGVDIAKVLRPNFKSFEDGTSIIMRTIEKNSIKETKFPLLIVWDTISASPTRSEIEKVSSGEISKVYSDKPILLRSFLRVLSGELSKTNSCFLLVSQVNDIIGGFGHMAIKYEPAGGRGIKHHTSARILVNKKAPIFESDDSKVLIGFNTDLQLWKSKQSPEKQKITVKQYFNSGFDQLSSLVDYLAASKYSHRDMSFNGAWIKLRLNGVDKSFNGMAKFMIGVSELNDFPIMDFFKWHAYENLKHLHPLTHLITRVNTIQDCLGYKPDETPEIQETKNDKK